MKSLTQPTTDEYAPFYSDYIERAQKTNVLSRLTEQINEINSALGALTDQQALIKDAPKEWSIKEIVGHINDAERVFSYRLLRISRNDQTPLSGFEQNDYVTAAQFDTHPIKDLVAEFEHLRRANILAIYNMSDEAVLRQGTASGATISARALIYILVGHVENHLASLHEKYLPLIK